MNWNVFFKSVADEKSKIDSTLQELREAGKVIFPHPDNIYRVFNTPPKKIRVVIIGMDPYPTGTSIDDCVAQGLAFSIRANTKIPGSLRNIFKEIEAEGFEISPTTRSGDLSEWADKGIFLLNTALTIEMGKTGSHLALWRPFTLALIKYLQKYNITWILWGKDAQKFQPYISNGTILTSAHPSPLSAKNFFGNGHFVEIQKCIPELEMF